MKKEIFFRKTGNISWMCEDYMEIEYKDRVEHIPWTGIFLDDDVIRIFGKWFSLWIDCSKKDKKWLRLFIRYDE